MAQKQCLGCVEKELSEFALDKSRPDGRCPYCKKCRARQEGERRRKANEVKNAILTFVCKKCGKEKLKSEFMPKRIRHKRSVHCIECRKLNDGEYYPKHLVNCKLTYAKHKENVRLKNKIRRDTVKTELVNFAGGKCKDCNLTFSEEWPVACFDFHHRNPEEKSFTIGSIIRHNSDMPMLLAEVKKCDLLCATCHRRRHHKFQLYQTKQLLNPNGDENNGG